MIQLQERIIIKWNYTMGYLKISPWRVDQFCATPDLLSWLFLILLKNFYGIRTQTIGVEGEVADH